MEKVKALSMLVEATELLKMVEDLTTLSPDRMSANIAGIRLTLKSARDRVTLGHDALARDVLATARSAAADTSSSSADSRYRALVQASQDRASTGTGASAVDADAAKRRDLRSTIDKSVVPQG